MAKKTSVLLQISLIAVFVLIAFGSGTQRKSMSSSNSSHSDAYERPVPPNSDICACCGGRGYIIRDGVKETCFPCKGTGKVIYHFPETR